MPTPPERFTNNQASAGSYPSSLPLDQPPPHLNGVNGTGLIHEETPELLRWRADLLMDEMMLSGVDGAAGDGGFHSSAVPNVSQSRQNGYAPHHPAQSLPSPDAHNARSSNGNGLLVSAEQRYAPYPPPVDAPSIATTPPIARQQNSNGVYAPPPTNGGSAESDLVAGYHNSEPGLGPVRRTVMPATEAVSDRATATATSPGAMAVNTRSSKYSTLLPRQSNVDFRTLQSEISALQEQVNKVLPVGHESHERARSQLEKAHSILQGDSLRSAEIDYYLQQVRALLDRMSQSFGYSNLYRNRLLLYLCAWLALGSVVIIGCSFFGRNLTSLFGEGESLFTTLGTQHLVALLVTLFVGGIGGAIGALNGMRRHLQREYGFFDRKFSLRSLMLPLIGVMVGLLLYIVIAPLYYLLGLDPSHNILALLLPVGLTLLFSFSQELLFSVRT